MKKQLVSAWSPLLLSVLLAGCGSGGGGGGDSTPSLSSGDEPGVGPAPTLADLEVRTYATTLPFSTYVGPPSAQLRNWGRVDLVDGGVNPQVLADASDPGNSALNKSKRAYQTQLMSLAGTDLDNNLADANGDGVPDSGFDPYTTGVGPGSHGARILGANNLYDMVQTTTGLPILFAGTNGGPPFTGGDLDGNGILDGGPGLFSNMTGASVSTGSPVVVSLVPKLPPLPNTMGTVGRGPTPDPDYPDTPTEEHQFIQIEFPYNLDLTSLFNPFNAGNSYLGDQVPGPTNVFVQERHVERSVANAVNNIVNRIPATVTVVAVIGGVASIPTLGGTAWATIDPDSLDSSLNLSNPSNIPDGARRLMGNPNVLTLIAHENPTGITNAALGTPTGFVRADGVLVLPNPTTDAGGGRVFGGTLGGTLHPGSVNDFATDGAGAAQIGFISVRITQLRTGGVTVANPYFHSFTMSQANVGNDPLAVLAKPLGSTRIFNRGPAISVGTVDEIPAIDVLSSTYLLPPVTTVIVSDASNTVSTKSRFRIDFDKEVVPNSVGFSRRYTIHSTTSKGIVFPFNGNSRPIASPASRFIPGKLGAPLAPSVYLAVNQPFSGAKPTLERKYNNPYAKNPNGNILRKDDGTLIDLSITNANQVSAMNAVNGLYPGRFNSLATLPRGVVPCDIYPVNQNNLQAYIIEPIIELPPNSVVTVGVCRPGLGTTNNNLNATMAATPLALNTVPQSPTNHGNYTRSGTVYSTDQKLSPIGLGDNTFDAQVIGNQTVIKVNAGPMDLDGLLFYGGTTTPLDINLDFDPQDDNSFTTGFFNVNRTFKVGADSTRPFVNVPVAPQAIAVGFSNGLGIGAIDLCGTGFNTNAPSGATEDAVVLSRILQLTSTGSSSSSNWSPGSSLELGQQQPAYGIIGRYTQPCLCPGAISLESEFTVAAAIQTGFGTPQPGVNVGSSGFETMSRDSSGSQVLTDGTKIKSVRDMILGDFLDTIFFDNDNPFATFAQHRTFNTPTQTGVTNNTIADPPIPNPPPLRNPVGLNFTHIDFNQDDLTQLPTLIEGSEVFNADSFVKYDDGTGVIAFAVFSQAYVQTNPSYNSTNPNPFDVTPLPNAGFPSPFAGENGQVSKFVQTGPLPETATDSSVVLAVPGSGFIPSGVVPPLYQSRQQIGNFLFMTDGVTKQLHAINSNNMKILFSLSLPDPYGLALTSDLENLYVTNEGDDSVSVVDADPRSSMFMTELKRIKVGQGPRGIAAQPDNEDVFVLNRIGNTISIIDIKTRSVRRTLSQSGINRPDDIALGMREVAGGPAFQSGTFHGFISNGGGDNILIYEGGPSGQAGIGFDAIIDNIKPNAPAVLGQPTLLGMDNPRGIVFDPVTPLDAFAGTIGAFVAHQDPVSGKALVSRVAYTADSSPGQDNFNINLPNGGLGEKVFAVIQQYVSSSTGTAFDVAAIDYNRDRLETSNFGTHANLYNSGATIATIANVTLPRNAKHPQVGAAIGGIVQAGARWEPDRLYLSSAGKRIDVFDVISGAHIKTISTVADVPVMTSYFEQ